MTAAPQSIQPMAERLRQKHENWSLGQKGPLILLEAAGRIENLETALREIVNPVQAMSDRAHATGDRIDGAMANFLARDPEYLRGIARAALEAKPAGETEA